MDSCIATSGSSVLCKTIVNAAAGGSCPNTTRLSCSCAQAISYCINYAITTTTTDSNAVLPCGQAQINAFAYKCTGYLSAQSAASATSVVSILAFVFAIVTIGPSLQLG